MHQLFYLSTSVLDETSNTEKEQVCYEKNIFHYSNINIVYA